ncbi:DNA polymerase III subunit gamma and tau [Aeromicrobium sp. CF3.5]
MDAPLALYRRYRPETFAEVIGQAHVTDPLRHALAANRTHHAYLFSGPRGCGKTTSARILARALNCEQAPIADPCGECQSCRDLARGGPGSIDVIEIDAASHGGVDDARDLRERAFFAPVSSRYKVYIIDEAHMVSAQGFNALLKLVEEPPPHLKFIFATTEPDKVIGTIRSRTHHYPFRLVPPAALTEYLQQLSAAEDVAVEPTALPLVVRAGQGSVRDTLSVLDQLLGGAGDDGLTYELAVQLLGYTPDSLLDEVADAMAARDGATVFGVIDKIIESGQDPRRFAEDLLQRLRDLIIISVVPDAAAQGLIEVPGDRVAPMSAQASAFGPAELARTADIVNAALMDFRGATAPRMLLELMCARILVPGADDSTLGLQARIDRLEKRLSIDVPAATTAPAPTPVQAPEPTTSAARPAAQPAAHAPAASPPAPEPEPRPESQPEPAPQVQSTPEPRPTPEPQPVPAHVEEPEPPAPAEPAAPAQSVEPIGTVSVSDLRKLWPDVLIKVQAMRRFAWVLLSQNAQVVDLEGNVVTLGLTNAGARESFVSNKVGEHVSAALTDVFGGTWTIDTMIDVTTKPAPTDPTPAPPSQPATPPPPRVDTAAAAQAVRDKLNEPGEEPGHPDGDAHTDDEIVDDGTTDPEELLTRELGAQIIDESTHD